MTHTKQKVAIRVAAILIMALAIIVTVTFAGCSMTSLVPHLHTQEKQTTYQQLADDSTLPPVATDPEPEPVRYFHPLTGVETTQQASIIRPVSICIGNTSNSLPQYGIGIADILVEIPVEGGISRLMMITTDYANAASIGSVRSTRSSLAQIANAFDAIQLYAGTCDEGTSAALPYDTMDYLVQNLPNVYYRDESRSAPHNLMTSGDLISAGIGSFGYRTEIGESFALPYDLAEYGAFLTPEEGNAKTVSITYSSAQTICFSYDSVNHAYLRKQNSKEQTDGNTGDALAFANLLVLYTDAITYDSAAGTTLDLSLERGGTGIWCSGGAFVSIKWTYDQTGGFHVTDVAGNPLTINRGRTYIGFMKVSQISSVVVK